MAEGAERFRGLWEDEMFARQGWDVSVFEIANLTVPVKRHRGEPGHTRTGHTGTRFTQTNLTTIQTHQPTQQPTAVRSRPRGESSIESD